MNVAKIFLTKKQADLLLPLLEEIVKEKDKYVVDGIIPVEKIEEHKCVKAKAILAQKLIDNFEKNLLFKARKFK